MEQALVAFSELSNPDRILPRTLELKKQWVVSRVLSRAIKLKYRKSTHQARYCRVFRQEIRMWWKSQLSQLLLWFCLHFLHRSLTAHWDACWLTSTWFINEQNKTTFLTFVFSAFLYHPPSPPRRFAIQKSRVTPGYKTIHLGFCHFEKDKTRIQ
jgi:hypothetical protein